MTFLIKLHFPLIHNIMKWTNSCVEENDTSTIFMIDQ